MRRHSCALVFVSTAAHRQSCWRNDWPTFESDHYRVHSFCSPPLHENPSSPRFPFPYCFPPPALFTTPASLCIPPPVSFCVSYLLSILHACSGRSSVRFQRTQRRTSVAERKGTLPTRASWSWDDTGAVKIENESKGVVIHSQVTRKPLFLRHVYDHLVKMLMHTCRVWNSSPN